MKIISIWLLLILLVCRVQKSSAARILVLLPMGSKSHKIALMPVIEELAGRGHNITIFSGYEFQHKFDNIKEFQLINIDVITEQSKINWYETEDGLTHLTKMMNGLPQLVRFAFDQLINHKHMKMIITDKSVDLVIVDAIVSEFTFPIIEHLGVPFVFHCSSLGISWAASALEAMGVDMDYASIPFPLTRFDDQMTFHQRLTNFKMAHTFRSLRQSLVFDVLDSYVKKDFPNARPTAEMMKEASLVLVNSHPTTDWPRSLPPSVIPIGAPHVGQTGELPDDLKRFADDAVDGLIIFTLGSIVKSSAMPEKAFQTFRRVFASIPQRVLWKWEGEIPENISSNVLMMKWLPQHDLIGHHNTKLFITHGGLLGIQEAIYQAVPVLGLPLCNDQHSNINVVTKQGFGLKLDWNDLNDTLLSEGVARLIDDSSFKANATRVSRLLRDELVPGKNLAVYWIEYVLRHGNTRHLQVNSKNVKFYKRYYLDALLLIMFSSIMFIFLCYYPAIRVLLHYCRNGSTFSQVKFKRP